MIYRMEIPGWQPALLNHLLRCNWPKRRRLKQNAAQQLGVARVTYGVPEATGKRRVRLVYVLGPRQKTPPDPDGVWKSLLYGLVAARLLVDDSKDWVEALP